MAKTYEELLAAATQIKNNELPESNTHTLVGGQLVDMVERQKEDVEGQEKVISELKKQEIINIAKTKFFVSDDVDLSKIYAGDFFGLIIQKVRVNWDKNSLPDIGQKWAITYLYVRSSEDKPYPEFDGRLTFTMLVDGKVRENASINLFDYGYTRGYKGFIEINNVRPYSSYNVTFDITIDCGKIVEDTIYQFGNMSGHYYEGKVYILPQFYFDTTDIYSDKDSYYYNVLANAGKDFPAWISPDVSRELPAIKVLNNVLLYAEIITTDNIEKYTYELAYINKTETNTEQFDNSVQLIRRLRSNIEKTDAGVTINHLDGIMNGDKFWIDYQWDNAFIRLYLDASKITYSPVFISNNQSQSVAKDGKQYIDKYCYKKIPNISNDLNVSNNTQIVKVIGENLYIGAKYDKDNDILITFRKCMFNNLMTFYKIGLADNKEAYPLSNPERTTSENLNVSTSDNIGPISTSSGGWCGGNHSYLEQSKVKTAETISYEFYADGIMLNDGDIVQATSVEVKVKNRIYNPTIPPEEGADILSEELCVEDVVYKIKNGNILVSLSHTYTNETPVTIANYYGMQSMCNFEDYIMTPNGRYVEFTEKATVAAFNKSEYPNFRRCIEKNADNNRYQSTYLLPYEAGTHEYINDENRIFSYSSGKCYNVLVVNKQIKSGDIIEWAGLYTWFTALQDDDNVLVYTGLMKGKTFLFIDVKNAVAETYIHIPPKLVGQEYDIVEKSESIITVGEVAGAKGLKFASNAAGSLILSFNLLDN